MSDDDLDRRVLGDNRRRWRSAVAIVTVAVRVEPWRCLATVAILIGSGSTVGLMAYAFKLLIDAIATGDRGGIVPAILLTAATGAVAGFSSLYGFLLRQRITESTQLEIDLRLMALTSEIAGLEHHERGDYVDQLTRLRERRGQLSSAVGAIANAISVAAQVLGSIGVLASVHPGLLALALAAIPSFFLEASAERIRRATWESTTERYRATRHLFGLATTAAAGKELRIFGLSDELLRRHELGMRTNASLNVRASARAAVRAALGWLVFAAAFVTALLFVAVRVIDGDAGPGDVAIVVALGSQLNNQVAQLVGTMSWMLQSLDIVRRYLWLEDQGAIARARQVADPRPVPTCLVDGITFERISFSYPGTDVEILSNVDLHLPAGSTVAIVGDNGAGKSTLVKLLCRFYEPTSGRILVDGTPLSHMAVEEWRSALSAGFQDFARPELAAQRSVGIGDLAQLDDAQAVRDALDRASAADVVAGLRDGLATQLGTTFDDGTDLSGGQWQKLALGRAMMRDAPLLLVLDEPTAAIDAETEHALFERFTGAAHDAARRNGAITLLVSHRFSTVRMADLIVVVDAGAVVEVGSHEALMARRGLYAELYDLQASGYR